MLQGLEEEEEGGGRRGEEGEHILACEARNILKKVYLLRFLDRSLCQYFEAMYADIYVIKSLEEINALVGFYRKP